MGVPTSALYLLLKSNLTESLREVVKARTTKYLRRYKGKDGKWRYVYPSKSGGKQRSRHEGHETTHSKVLGDSSDKHYHAGASFAAGKGKGHYIIEASEGGQVTFHLDEDATGKRGETQTMSRKDFRHMLREEHREEFEKAAKEGLKRREKLYAECLESGSQKHIDRAAAEVARWKEANKVYLRDDGSKAINAARGKLFSEAKKQGISNDELREMLGVSSMSDNAGEVTAEMLDGLRERLENAPKSEAPRSDDLQGKKKDYLKNRLSQIDSEIDSAKQDGLNTKDLEEERAKTQERFDNLGGDKQAKTQEAAEESEEPKVEPDSKPLSKKEILAQHKETKKNLRDAKRDVRSGSISYEEGQAVLEQAKEFFEAHKDSEQLTPAQRAKVGDLRQGIADYENSIKDHKEKVESKQKSKAEKEAEREKQKQAKAESDEKAKAKRVKDQEARKKENAESRKQEARDQAQSRRDVEDNKRRPQQEAKRQEKARLERELEAAKQKAYEAEKEKNMAFASGVINNQKRKQSLSSDIAQKEAERIQAQLDGKDTADIEAEIGRLKSERDSIGDSDRGLGREPSGPPPNKDTGDHGGAYEWLGVKKDASPQEIKEAFREKAKTAHPDRGGDEEEFKKIKAAHDMLSDESKRSRYDQHGNFRKESKFSIQKALTDMITAFVQFEVSKALGDVDLTPTDAMASNARRGLEMRKKASDSNKGGLDTQEAGKQGIGSGVARAASLANKKKLSPETVRQMKAFFDRHSAYKHKHKSDPGGKAQQSWLLWGGDAAYAWAKRKVEELDRAKEVRKAFGKIDEEAA